SFGIEPVKLRRAMPPCQLLLFQRYEDAEPQNLFPKIPLIQARAEDGLIQMLELRERELRRQQFETDWLVTHLGLQPPQRHSEDLPMVERQARSRERGKPVHVPRVRGRFHAVVTQLYQRVV